MKHYTQKDGRRLYARDRAQLMADPRLKQLYDAEAAKKEIWLQQAEARQAAELNSQPSPLRNELESCSGGCDNKT